MALTDVRRGQLQDEFAKVERVLAAAPAVDKFFQVPREEFKARQERVAAALAARGLTVGLVFSDEHYDGDVPYLGGAAGRIFGPAVGIAGRLAPLG